MTPVADKIMARVRERESGKWVCMPKDFLDLGSRAAVDRIMQWTGKIASPVVQALHWLGPATANDQVVAILKRCLPDAVKQDLRRNDDQLPPWMLPLARSITADQALSE